VSKIKKLTITLINYNIIKVIKTSEKQ